MEDQSKKNSENDHGNWDYIRVYRVSGSPKVGISVKGGNHTGYIGVSKFREAFPVYRDPQFHGYLGFRGLGFRV